MGQLRSSVRKWNKIYFSCDLSLYNKPKTSSAVLCCQCYQLSVLPQCWSEYLEFAVCGLNVCEGFGFLGAVWHGKGERADVPQLASSSLELAVQP